MKHYFYEILILFFLFSLTNTATATENEPDHGQSSVKLYSYPTICPSSKDYKVRINGEEAFVYYSSAGSFVALEGEGKIKVEIQTQFPAESIEVFPKRLGIEPEVKVHSIQFEMDAPGKVLCEIPEMEQLFIYADSLDPEKPDPEDENVHYFKEGQVYEVGLLKLKDNQTL
ncbi:MAG: hypothetical protein ACP5E3_15900, partial [Bacteroidales bacterium]